MTNYLKDYSVAELQAEIERRKNQNPHVAKCIFCEGVMNIVEDAVRNLDEGNGLPHDFEASLAPAVLEAMYGSQIFSWWNKKVKGE